MLAFGMTLHLSNMVEVFAGTGGASYGLHRAGWAHLACVECDAAAAATLAS